MRVCTDAADVSRVEMEFRKMNRPISNDPMDVRRRRGVRITVIVVVTAVVLIYVGVLSGVLSL